VSPPIWARRTVAPFELLTGAYRADVCQAVEGEDAVKVVDLVLEELGQIAFGAEGVRVAGQILVLDVDPCEG
jgi:hypothetical protein